MKKIFSVKLYLDGLSKTKVFGIISIILTTVLSGFVAIISASDAIMYDYFQIMDTTSFALPTAIVLLLAPFSVYLQFNFLNKRSSSDFYHALPFTRTQLCLSYFASVVTWITAAILIPIALCSVVYTICPMTGFEASVPFLCFFGFLGAAILLMSLMLIAMSLTGTTVSNILVFGIITLFFRLIFTLFTFIFEDLVPICDMSAILGSFFSPDFFLPIQILSLEDLFTNTASIVYAYVIAVLCTIGGTLLFIHRHSESADKSAISRVFQNIFRCAISIPTAILTVLSLIDLVVLDGALGLNDMFLFILFLIITLIIYFLYEIITTKGVTTLLKTIPQLGIVFAAALVFWSALEFTKNYVYSFEPAAEELQSISLSFNEDYLNSYEDLKTSNIKINDPEALELASKVLSSSIDASRNNRYYSRYNQYYTSLDFITKDGKTVRRNLTMSEDDYTTLESVFLGSEDYREAQLSLPNDDEILNYYINSSVLIAGFDDTSLEQNFYDRIWQSFKEEYATLSDEDKAAVKSNSAGCIIGSLSINGTLNGNSFYSDYSISELTPKTAELLISFSGNSDDISTIKDVSNSLLSDTFDYTYYDVSAEIFDLESGTSYALYYTYSEDYTFEKQQISTLLSTLSPYYENALDITSPMVWLNISYETVSDEGYEYYNYSIAFSITDELQASLLSLFGYSIA